MNRKKAEQWLSQAMDGELSPRRTQQLEAWLKDHPEEGQAIQSAWKRVGEQLRAVQPLPRQTPEAAWSDVRRELRKIVADPEPSKMLWRLSWAGAAVALVFLLVSGIWLRQGATPGVGSVIAHADRTEVEWVETDLPDAVSMVYEDEKTGLTVIWVWLSENGEDDGPAGT